MITCPGSPGPAAVGFVAGKKVGSAVLRNRAKRRLREAAARCNLRSDTVYVVIADSGVLTADFDSLVDTIDRCTREQPKAEERA